MSMRPMAASVAMSNRRDPGWLGNGCNSWTEIQGIERQGRKSKPFAGFS